MKINIFCFSCEWTISYVDLPWGRYGCSSTSTKVLHDIGNFKCSWFEWLFHCFVQYLQSTVARILSQPNLPSLLAPIYWKYYIVKCKKQFLVIQFKFEFSKKLGFNYHNNVTFLPIFCSYERLVRCDPKIVWADWAIFEKKPKDLATFLAFLKNDSTMKFPVWS